MNTVAQRSANTFVYVDESGTFPLENDNLFVVAALAFRREVPDTLDKHTATLDAVLEKLRELDGVMAIHYVKPVDDFVTTLKRKLETLELMARAAKLVKGQHPYMSGNEIKARNMMWGECVRMAAASAIVSALVKGPVGLVDVIVDRKTMTDASRRLFNDQAELMPQHLVGIRDLPGLEGKLIATPTTIRFRLSNDKAVKNAKGGLRLADVIAYSALQELRETGDVSSLRRRDRRDGIIDLAPFLLEPISREAIEQYKRNTGLPEPMP